MVFEPSPASRSLPVDGLVLLDASPVAHALIDADGVVVWANAAFRVLFADTGRVVDGAGIRSLFEGDPEPMGPKVELLRDGVLRAITDDRRVLGAGIDVRYSLTLLGGVGSSLPELLATVERIVADDTRDRFRDLAVHASDLITRHAADGRFIWVSPSARTILGCEPQDLVGRSTADLVHPDDVATITKAFALANRANAAGPPVAFRVRFVRPDGRLIHLDVHAQSARGADGRILEVHATSRDVTEQVVASAALAASERALRQRFEGSAVATAVIGPDLTVVDANPALCTLLGHRRDRLVGRSWCDVVHPEDGAGAGPDPSMTTVRSFRCLRPDGDVRQVRATFTVLAEDARPGERGWIAQLDDQTARHEVEERFRRAFDDAAVGSALVSIEPGTRGRVLRCNRALAALLGRSNEEVEAMRVTEFTHPDDVASSLEAMDRLTRGEITTWQAERRYLRPDGSIVWLQLSTSAVLAPDGTRRHVISQMQDISARKAMEAELRHAATHDPLTGLPNRRHLRELLAAALGPEGPPMAGILFLDLDRFKVVNDTLGHRVGDDLLVAVAVRLSGALPDGAVLARLGGDEFVVLVPDGRGERRDRLDRVAGDLHAALVAPFLGPHVPFWVSVSIGMAVIEPASDPEELLRRGDVAMYRAKAAGRGVARRFEAAAGGEPSRLDLEADLRRGLLGGELVVHYQPVVDLRSGAVTGVEALARWDHPRRGLLGPSAFLELAEDTGLVVELGRRVLEDACAQGRAWRDQGHPLQVAVNASVHQLQTAGYPATVVATLARNQLDPSSLCIEVTESVLIDRDGPAARALVDLRAAGVAIAIDDFGTGYSSLAYLKRFPVDLVKIDRTFLDGVDVWHRDASVVAGVIRLVHALGMGCIAEGVETDQQLLLLQSLGCDSAQGFRLGRPAPAWVGAAPAGLAVAG